MYVGSRWEIFSPSIQKNEVTKGEVSLGLWTGSTMGRPFAVLLMKNLALASSRSSFGCIISNVKTFFSSHKLSSIKILKWAQWNHRYKFSIHSALFQMAHSTVKNHRFKKPFSFFSTPPPLPPPSSSANIRNIFIQACVHSCSSPRR